MVPAKDRIDPKRTCMVFFDVAPYVKGDAFGTDDPSKSQMVSNWQNELLLARKLEMMIAFPQTAQRPDAAAYFPRRQDIGDGGQHMPPGWQRPISRNLLGAPHIRVIEDIATGPNDYIFWKERWDPWQGTNFESSLRLRGVDTIIANGGATEIGIASTAYGAHRLDFDIVFVSDGCYSGHPNDHNVFMTKIFNSIGRVRTADEVLAMLTAA